MSRESLIRRLRGGENPIACTTMNDCWRCGACEETFYTDQHRPAGMLEALLVCTSCAAQYSPKVEPTSEELLQALREQRLHGPLEVRKTHSVADLAVTLYEAAPGRTGLPTPAEWLEYLKLAKSLLEKPGG